MFGKNKDLKEIEIKLLELKKEKKELLKIKELLEDKTAKIDISNVYVWNFDGISYLVRYYTKPIEGISLNDTIILRDYFESTLIDIFSEQVVYKKYSPQLIKERELVKDLSVRYTNKYASFKHILDVDRELLAFPDKKVPKYILQKKYYSLNNIDITKSKVLNKVK